MNAAGRVREFIGEWEKMIGHDPDIVYGLHRSTEREAILTVADLRALVAIASVRGTRRGSNERQLVLTFHSAEEAEEAFRALLHACVDCATARAAGDKGCLRHAYPSGGR